LAARLVGVDPPGRLPDGQFRGSKPGMSFGERERDGLVSTDWPAEDHPVGGIANCAAQCCPPYSECLGSNQHPLGVEPVEQITESPALLAAPVGSVHVQAVVADFARGDSVPA